MRNYREVEDAPVLKPLSVRAMNPTPNAQIRQYFKDDTFYENDVNARGLCDATTAFVCEAFSPYAATVKVRGTFSALGETQAPQRLWW